MAFKSGDTVMLKSGGPVMTVTSTGVNGDPNSLWCMWFEGDKRRSGIFTADALMAVDLADLVVDPAPPRPRVGF